MDSPLVLKILRFIDVYGIQAVGIAHAYGSRQIVCPVLRKTVYRRVNRQIRLSPEH
jgi:hypothetical protein